MEAILRFIVSENREENRLEVRRKILQDKSNILEQPETVKKITKKFHRSLSKMNTRSQTKKKSSSTDRFECDSCNKTFAWKKDLHRHERYHQPNTKKFPCPHCERRFIRKDKLSSHLLVHMTGIAKSNFLKKIQYFAQSLFTDKKFTEIMCMLCNYKASNIPELRQHLSMHKNIESTDTNLSNSEVVKRFYPEKNEQEIIQLITGQLNNNQFGKFYSITNSHSYEMGISDSDETDPEAKTQYVCELCDMSFNRKHKLMKHHDAVHIFDECPYKCERCKLKFTCQRVLNSHLRNHCENSDRELQCKKCPGRFTWPKNFENHTCSKKKSPAKEIFYCEVCEMKFNCPKDLRKHKKCHIPDGKSRDCSVCSEKFLRPENLRSHLKTHLKNIHKHLQLKSKFSCMLCQKDFTSIHSLKCHLIGHSDGQTDVNFKNCGFVSNFFPDENETTVAEYIRGCFEEQKLWRLYMAVNKLGIEMVLSDSDSEDEHKSAEAYICELCDLKFTRMQAILEHQYVEHDSKNIGFPHKCSKCDDQFVCAALLSRHTKSECMNLDRVHACTKCNMKFTWKQNLIAHKCLRAEKSSGDKKCEVCGKKFVWLKDLHRHKRSHIDEKKFECLVCGRKFNRKDNMRAHMKVHTPDCKVRGKSTPKWEQQDQNMCRPHGVKVIQCKICMSKHDSIRDLSNHLMTHNDCKITLKQDESEVMGISMRLYNKPMNRDDLAEAISNDLANNQHDRFYSITNEVGYELDLIDSETSSDLDANDDDDSGDGVLKGYNCCLCNKTFDRKFKMFDHQSKDHAWDKLPLECGYCGAKFASVALHHLHLQNECENINKQFKCKSCPLKFTWKENLKYHERYNHYKNPMMQQKYDCDSCDKSFLWQKDLMRHKKIHQPEEDKFECTWCFRIFMRKDNLKVHMKVHQNTSHLQLPDIYYLARPNGTKVAKCKHCDQKYSTAFELRQHIQSSHLIYQMVNNAPDSVSYSITNALGYEMDIDDSETEREEPIEKYTCDLCQTRFFRRFKLLQHQQSCHYSDDIPHKCNHCNFKCVSESVLNYHMRTQCMNEGKLFRCSKCTMRFMWQENLENHESLIHCSPRNYTCQKCKRDFATQHDLKSHSGCKPPTDAKLFKCDLCDRQYNRKDRLMKHVKEHSAESKEPRFKISQSACKKFLCAFCGKEVSSSSNLVIHMRRHTGEKPFKCEFCNKGFPRSSDLSCHRRTHTGERPHKCTVCDKAFSRSYKLQTHMRIHSGERPYKCTYCEKSFTQSNDLTLHVRRHTGERPYICETCGERFIQGTALRNHRRMRGHYET